MYYFKLFLRIRSGDHCQTDILQQKMLRNQWLFHITDKHLHVYRNINCIFIWCIVRVSLISTLLVYYSQELLWLLVVWSCPNLFEEKQGHIFYLNILYLIPSTRWWQKYYFKYLKSKTLEHGLAVVYEGVMNFIHFSISEDNYIRKPYFLKYKVHLFRSWIYISIVHHVSIWLLSQLSTNLG